MTITKNKIDFTRVNNDVNGNPRYVIHFLSLISKYDLFTSIDQRYNLALRRAKNLGGRKYHNKSYGGGIVFQSFNNHELEQQINELLEFVPEWNPKQFTKVNKAITKHFKGKAITTLHGLIIGGNNIKKIADQFGLAYTSSSMCAMYSICNTEVVFSGQWKYEHFVLGKDGIVYAMLGDKDENTQIIEL